MEQEPLVLNVGRPRVTLEVHNDSAWPVGVGSHFHFFEVNRRLRFERERAYGMKLDIPAGAIVWFSPGESRNVTLVALAGRRQAWGFNGLVNGPLEKRRDEALVRARERGFIPGGSSRG